MGDDVVNIDIIKGKQKEYQGFIKEKTEEKEIKQIRGTLQQNKAFGRKSFKLRQRGRPVKVK